MSKRNTKKNVNWGKNDKALEESKREINTPRVHNRAEEIAELLERDKAEVPPHDFSDSSLEYFAKFKKGNDNE
jgi:hypothetical protein